MEEVDDIDLGLGYELERALEMEEGKRHVSHDLTIFTPFLDRIFAKPHGQHVLVDWY